MEVPELIQRRLLNQQITHTTFKKAEEIVRTMAAMQAQEFAHAKWAIGLRLPHAIDTEIENAFTTGELIRTHILRPTWHFVSSKDIRWLLSLSAPRVKAVNAFMIRKSDLDNKIFKKANDIFVKALEGGKQLTRTKLAAELEKKKIFANGFRLSYIMMQAELDGIICSGAKEGKQFTYALFDERVPASKPMKEDEALAELADRYFNSRGPATIKDFATWSGLTQVQVKNGLAMVINHFDHVKIENTEYYFPRGFSYNTLAKEIAGRSMHLLPIYDEYIMSYKDKGFHFNLKNKVSPSSSLVFENAIILKGQIAGTWKRIINKQSIDLEYNLFKDLNRADKKEFILAVNRYSKFMRLPVILKNKVSEFNKMTGQ